jgi:hypothetical protein
VDVVRKAGREEAAPELGLARDREPPRAEPGPGAPDGLETFVEQRVVDDGDDAQVAALDPDRHAEAGKAVGEVRRAVERVDDPAELGARRGADAAFLGEDGVARKGVAGSRRR